MLELKTARERKAIKIDGVAYEMVETDELKLKDVLWLEKAGKRLKTAAAALSEEDSDEQSLQELSVLIRQFVAVIAPTLPGEVGAKLSDVQLMSIIFAYMEGAGATPFGKTLAEMSGATGSTSSPGSSGSTGEAPSPG